MTTENVMKLGKIERLSFSFVLLSFLQICRSWPLEKIKQMILSMYCIIKKHNKNNNNNNNKKKKKHIKNQFELNSEKCIKVRMLGPKIHIELSVISR